MKRLVLVLVTTTLIFSILYFSSNFNVEAESSISSSAKVGDSSSEETLQLDEVSEKFGLDFTEIDGEWNNALQDYEEFVPSLYSGSILDIIKENHKESFPQLLKGLFQYIFYEIVINWKILGTLIILAVFSAFLQAIQSSFEKTTVSKVANAIVIMSLLLVALNSFRVIGVYIAETVTSLVNFLMAMIPLFLALVTTNGGVITTSFFHPILYFMMNISSFTVQYVVIPLLITSTILGVINELSDSYNVSALCKWLQSVGVWILGIMFVVSLSVLSIQGFFTAVSDGLGTKSVKFVTSNFIPVVGRMFSEATDTIMGAGAILKNAVGLTGLLILFCMIAFPALKIFAVAIIYRLAIIILQPLSNGKLIKSLEWIGKNLYYMLGAYLLVAVMFFLAVTIMVMASNVMLMVR